MADHSNPGWHHQPSLPWTEPKSPSGLTLYFLPVGLHSVLQKPQETHPSSSPYQPCFNIVTNTPNPICSWLTPLTLSQVHVTPPSSPSTSILVIFYHTLSTFGGHYSGSPGLNITFELKANISNPFLETQRLVLSTCPFSPVSQ